MSFSDNAPAAAASQPGPTTQLWRDSRFKRLAFALAAPVFLVLNRPALQWFAHAAYDFALRCNGVAINFHGRHGLTMGEENFVRARLRGSQAGMLLDVGANNGTYTLYLRHICPHAVIYAFEPHPRTFATLCSRIAGDPAIRPLNLAVSAESGRLKLYDFAAEDGSTQASLDKEAVHLFSSETVAHDVAVTTIDSFMVEHDIQTIDLLKIDTEGFDLAVLQGARNALAARAIAAIQFEFIPANIARHVTMRDFFDILRGYRIYRVCMNGSLMPLAVYDVKRCEIYVTQNLVALPE